MDIKKKLVALGIAAAAIKNKSDEQLQALLDEAVLEFTSTGKPLPWEGGEGGEGADHDLDDQGEPRDDGLIVVRVLYGFRGPAKDRCEHQGEVVRAGELLNVKPGDELALGELTFAWLARQSLVAKG